MKKQTSTYNQPSLFDWLEAAPEPKAEDKTAIHATIEIGAGPKREVGTTPLMRQYHEMKAKHPDAVLLFRVGDFYETFCEDAIDASKILGITLTRRTYKGETTELAGFPHHALDKYLPMIVRAGRRVAICEQLEDPRTTKKLVKRGINN